MLKEIIENNLNEKVSKKEIFNGYEEVVTDYWGFDPDDIEEYVDKKVLKSPWWTKPCCLAALDEMDEKYQYEHPGVNEKEVVVVLDGVKVKAFSLTGDGGFFSYLIDPKDAEKLTNFVWAEK